MLNKNFRLANYIHSSRLKSILISKTPLLNFSTITSLSIPTRLKKNFYKDVELLEVKNSSWNKILTESEKNQKHLPHPTLKRFSTGSELNEYYYHILLEKKKCKSMYLDELKIPNKILAIALAKEWAKQKEFVNLYSMHLNFYASSGIRIAKDEELKTQIINELSNYIETDQVCFLENKIIDFIEQEEKENLRDIVAKIFNYIAFDFEIELRKSESLLIGHHKHENNHENVFRIKHALAQFDPWVLAILEQITGITKSICISLALLENLVTPKQAYLISHSEEFYQMKKHGEVEGHHDIVNELVIGKLYSALCFHKMLYI